ncbi:MAG TPA: hypothetical protein VFJ07_05600 [Streptosporangiaceae bacterium]|nr:hypothetical protein [Streptosporangiaceae bacterium]
MVADLIRALLAGAAGAVLPGYFWAAVLRPTSGLGERLAWSTGISMASVPTVTVILARVTRGGVALWVALAAVLIVFGSGLLVYRLRGPAPGAAAPVLRMPDPTRDPRVLGLVAVAIALGLLMMPAHRPPAGVLAVIAVALIAGGVLMAWHRPAEPGDSPPAPSPESTGFLSAPPPAPEPVSPAPAAPAGPSGSEPGAAGHHEPAQVPAPPASAGAQPAAASTGPATGPRPFGLPLPVVRDGGLAVILVLTACRVYSGVVRFEWPYVSGGDQYSHAVMAEQMLAHGQYPGYLIYPPGFSALTAVICRFAGLTPLELFPVLAPMLLVVTALGAYALATRLWGWEYGLGAAALSGLVLTGAFNGFAGGRYPDLISAFFLLVMTVAALITVYEAPTVRSAVLVTVVGAAAVFYHSVATLYAAVLFVLVALICLPYLLRGRHRPETRALLLALAGVAVLAACYAIYVYNPGGILGGKSSTGGAVSIVLGSQAPASQGALLKELGAPIVWFGILGAAALAASLRWLRRPAQVLTAATVVAWCVVMYLGSRTSLDGFPQRFERDLGAPLSVMAAFGTGLIVRSLPIRGAVSRTAPALAAVIAGILAAMMLLAQTGHAVKASDRSAGELLSHRVAAAGQWLARHNTGGTIISTPNMNPGITNRAVLAMGGYTGLQSYSAFRIAHPRSLPTAGKAPLLDSQEVLLHPQSCQSANILVRQDVRYVVLYRIGSGADLPGFAADPAHYQQVFENPAVIIYATHRTGCG